ncbi:MAG: cell division protein ZapE [Rhodospirillaceae bacterium]|jgi:cell division protein ZapE|nr:cell division protein ZapE [Rhodospirillaceae bacterium]MBT4218743.1 cell division protein ZapE [Rhodospirillaceae bacterium]MBT4463466.1 cell division protein ZapE [Rhodospirillaceae bacterium]MBT5013277.1 cell division protein ZapE [Rhodospirillaceae bacterium]MBT5308528.1 cell division protein ZapE [Rhodospirillaceae bacterium]
MLEGPLNSYRIKQQSGEIRPDPVQALAIEKLQSLHMALKSYDASGEAGGWKERFGLARRREEPPQGLYLFGGVGRGKTLLMDMFFRTAPVERKRRIHFHSFMQQVHARLNEYRKWKGRGNDPIPPIAKQFAAESTLLCFDELQILDIADAMIIGRFFETLFEEGVVVVATSNRPPHDLYKDGLQRAKFLPFIDLLEERMDPLMLDGPTDYRLESIRSSGTYVTPADKKAKAEMARLFERLTNEAEEPDTPIIVNGRKIHMPMAADGVALTGFDDICGQPLGPADYLAISGRYHTLLIHSIPRMGPDNRNEAKRFVTLIDALYEQKTKLICSADAQPAELYVDGDGAFEFERTSSRLIEMQSEDYLATPQRAKHRLATCKAGSGTPTSAGSLPDRRNERRNLSD